MVRVREGRLWKGGREGQEEGDVSVSAHAWLGRRFNGKKGHASVCECLALVYRTHVACALDEKNRVHVCLVSWERETLPLTPWNKITAAAERVERCTRQWALTKKETTTKVKPCVPWCANKKESPNGASQSHSWWCISSKQASKRSLRLSGDAASRWCPSR